MTPFLRALPAFAVVAASASVAAASFPCEKAQSRVEKAICADTELSSLDEYLGRYYAAARAALGAGAACLTDDQRRWLRTRDTCTEPACLRKAYLERLSVLDGLQPGVTALRNVALPDGPVLAWIVPAVRDHSAAPAHKGAKPFTARGALLDEVARGDGFVLRTSAGERHIVALLMFLEGSTAERLAALARRPGGTVVAEGHSVVDPAGRTNFDPGQCVFVYRSR